MKRGKKVLCFILSLALFCALALPAHAAEPWRALEGIAYYGDRSKCAMTEEQARAFVEVIENEMARRDWLGEHQKMYDEEGTGLGYYAALFDLGNGTPALFFVRGFSMLYGVGAIDVGEPEIWVYENGRATAFAPVQRYDSCVLYDDAICVITDEMRGEAPDLYRVVEVYSYRDGAISSNKVDKPSNEALQREDELASARSGWFSVDYEVKGLTPIDQFKPALLSYVSAAQTSTRVTLHLNGGTGGSALWTNDSGTIQVPTNPTREGYTFGGWFTDPDLTVAWNFNSAVTGELALYAKWVPVSSSASTVGQNTQAISFNGGLVEVQAYTLKADNGGDVTYVKLRDMAALLDGSAAQFNVDWRNGAIYVERGKPYTTRNGTELRPIAGTDGSYEWNTAPILFDGTTTAIEGIVLEGTEGSHTFLKLRDLANAIGFTVDWSAEKGIAIGTE